jgi:hypothetical protein
VLGELAQLADRQRAGVAGLGGVGPRADLRERGLDVLARADLQPGVQTAPRDLAAGGIPRRPRPRVVVE